MREAKTPGLSRRLVIAGASCLLASGRALAEPVAEARLLFEVRRNGRAIGTHSVRFQRQGERLAAIQAATMVVKLGPVPVFHYRHEAEERWEGGRFVSLRSTTVTNGRREQVSAIAEAGAVRIDATHGVVLAPADAAPLTHWNSKALTRPLFNPQTGRMLKVRATRRVGDPQPFPGVAAAYAWLLRGEAHIDDWYDDGGAWLSLRGHAPDGSVLEYRRLQG